MAEGRPYGAARLLLCLCLAVLLPPGQPPARAQWPVKAIADPAEEIQTVKVADGSRIKVRVLRPKGSPPFPLAIVSHGAPASASGRPKMEVPTLRPISDWLLAKGYMVALPLLGRAPAARPRSPPDRSRDSRGCRSPARAHRQRARAPPPAARHRATRCPPR